jgi:adenine-specific DNA-methyltransferase
MRDRLELLHRLLSVDGFLFVQIDDNEQAYLRILLDEIFGRSNFVATLIWIGRAGKGGTATQIANQHEYIHCYQKNNTAFLKREQRVADGGNYEDETGKYKREQLRQWGQGDRREDRPSMWYPIKAPDETEIYPLKDDGSEGRWRVSESTFYKLYAENLIEIVKIDKSWKVYKKIRDGRITESVYGTLLDNYGTSATGTSEIKRIFGSKTFETPKPEKLISHLITFLFWPQTLPSTKNSSMILLPIRPNMCSKA